MSLGAALPAYIKERYGIILSFVVPYGCNMRCPFCFIKQRKENTTDAILSPDDYESFILSVAQERHIQALCIQGHEPLLPEAIVYTKKILAVGQTMNIPTSLITNGTYLEKYAFLISKFEPISITVSLDSFIPSIHDKIRGLEGSFESILRGLNVATQLPSLRDRLSIASTLLPKRREYLQGIPKLLSKLGIRRWNINALVKVESECIGGPVGHAEEILEDLRLLTSEANQHGIELAVDDEFDRMGRLGIDERKLRAGEQIRVEKLIDPAGLFRLNPDGQCSVGEEILRTVSHCSKRWNPKEEDAKNFLQRLY